MKMFFLLLLLFTQANAWDGYDWKRHSYVEVETGNSVKSGEDIEYYEYGKGYGNLSIDDIEEYAGHVMITGTDSYGTTRTFEMD